MKNTLSSSKNTTKVRREIDWQLLYDRIASTKLMLENAGQASDEKRERIWRERAHQFSQVVEEEDLGDVAYLVIVSLGRELCAFDVTYVESIRPVEQITRVPRTPDWICGISNLRGQIYTVTDLQRFLHLSNGQEASTGAGEIVLVRNSKLSLALRVDRVVSVDVIQEDRICTSVDTTHGVKPEYVRGVIEDYGKGDEKIPVLVLDMNSMLSDEYLLVREEFA
jgi:purine-binding chemotaxis protein CheW